MQGRGRRGAAEVIYGDGETFIVEDVQHGWHLQGWFELRDGVPRLAELRIRSATGATLRAAHGPDGPRAEYPYEAGRKLPPGGLTSPTLRGLSVAALHDALGKDNASAGLLGAHGFDPDEDFRRVRRPGRGGRDDAFYAAWAERYVAKCATTRRPYPQLVEEYGHGYEVATIRDFIKEARERKLLTRNSPGRAGGELTSKAKRLLARGNRQ